MDWFIFLEHLLSWPTFLSLAWLCMMLNFHRQILDVKRQNDTIISLLRHVEKNTRK